MDVEKVVNQSVGGLREIGFIEDTDNLLVLGGGGRTIFDCMTGEKIARDRNDYYSDKWDSDSGVVEGFDFCEGSEIVCGGFQYPDQIIKNTHDNWEIEICNEKRLDYKNELKNAEVMYLVNVCLNRRIEVEVYHYSITRSYGFSRTGKSFITAQSYGLDIWARCE